MQRRLKEIGIRKTLGASFGHVLNLLPRELTWMMAIAVVFGFVSGTYVVNMLLDIIYAYRVEIGFIN